MVLLHVIDVRVRVCFDFHICGSLHLVLLPLTVHSWLRNWWITCNLFIYLIIDFHSKTCTGHTVRLRLTLTLSPRNWVHSAEKLWDASDDKNTNIKHAHNKISGIKKKNQQFIWDTKQTALYVLCSYKPMLHQQHEEKKKTKQQRKRIRYNSMFVYLLDFFHFVFFFFALPRVVELLIRSSIEMSPTLSQKMSNPTHTASHWKKCKINYKRH